MNPSPPPSPLNRNTYQRKLPPSRGGGELRLGRGEFAAGRFNMDERKRFSESELVEMLRDMVSKIIINNSIEQSHKITCKGLYQPNHGIMNKSI